MVQVGLGWPSETENSDVDVNEAEIERVRQEVTKNMTARHMTPPPPRDRAQKKKSCLAWMEPCIVGLTILMFILTLGALIWEQVGPPSSLLPSRPQPFTLMREYNPFMEQIEDGDVNVDL